MTNLSDIKNYIEETPENTNSVILLQMVQDYNTSSIKGLLKEVNVVPEVVAKGYYFIDATGVLRKGTAIIGSGDSGGTETPDEFALEYGKKYFTDLIVNPTQTDLENYFKDNKNYHFSSQSGEALVNTGMAKTIPSLSYVCNGYKLEDYNSTKETYILFQYILYDSTDKQNVINFLKSNLTGEYLKSINYYTIQDNYTYMESIDGSQESITAYTEGKSFVSYDRKDGLYIKNNTTNEVTQIYSKGRSWNIHDRWLKTNNKAIATSTNNGVIVVDSTNDSVTVLADSDTWNDFSSSDTDNMLYVKNADNTKQISYNLETGESSITDVEQQPTVKLSKFNVDGTSYEFEEGSIFKDWVHSKYNTIGLVQGEQNLVQNSDKTKVLSLDEKNITINDTVLSGKDYILINITVEK